MLPRFKQMQTGGRLCAIETQMQMGSGHRTGEQCSKQQRQNTT